MAAAAAWPDQARPPADIDTAPVALWLGCTVDRPAVVVVAEAG